MPSDHTGGYRMGAMCSSGGQKRNASELDTFVRAEELRPCATSSTTTAAAAITESCEEWRHRCDKRPTTISDLPDDVLLMIFSYFDFVNIRLAGRVCRKWYTLTREATLNRHIDLSNMELSPNQFELFVNAGTLTCIESLTVLGSPNWLWLTDISASTISMLSKSCPQLRRLKIENFTFRSIPKFRLCDFPSTLEVLCIRGSIVDRRELFEMNSDRHVMLEHLRVLDIGLCFFNVDGEVKPFPTLPRLSQLFLEGCPFIDSLAYLTDLLLKCPMLTVLDVEATYIVRNALCLIGTHCINMKFLYIGCTSLNDSVIFNLPERSFLNLQGICIIQTAVTYAGLLQLVNSLPSLVHIRCDLRYMSQQGISRIIAQTVSSRRSQLHFEVTTLRLQSVVFRSDGCGHATGLLRHYMTDSGKHHSRFHHAASFL